MSLQSLANAYKEAILAFTWRQWSQLGILAARSHPDRWCQDPEALLLFSLEVTRQEPRAFDEILDWLIRNGQTIMVHRVKHLLARDQNYPGGIAYAALELTGVSKNAGASSELHAMTSLFPMFISSLDEEASWDEVFLKHGFRRPAFKRSSKSKAVRLGSPVALAFKLRAVFGASARAEALRFLLLNPGRKVGTSEIAEAALLSRFGIQQALEELHQAGLIRRGTRGRKDLVWWVDSQNALEAILALDGEPPAWVNWPAVFHGLSLIWRWLLSPDRERESAYVLSSGARTTMRDAAPLIVDQGLDWRASNSEGYRGPAYLPVFIEDIRRLVEALNGQQASGQRDFETTMEALAHRRFSLSRSIEVPTGHLDAGKLTGRALDLSLKWRAFGDVSAVFQRVEVADGMQVLNNDALLPGRLMDATDMGYYEGYEEDGRKVELSHAFIRGFGISLSSESSLNNVRMRFRYARLTHRARHNPAYVRFLFGNLELDIWPHATRTTDGSWSRDSLQFQVGSYPILLTRLSSDPAVSALVSSEAIDFEESLRRATDIATFLSFLAGAPVALLGIETYDDDGMMLDETLFPATDPPVRPRNVPIRWGDLEDGRSPLYARMPAAVSSMLANYLELKDAYDFPALIGCLNAARGLPVEVETLLTVTAIKKLAQSWGKTSAAKPKTTDTRPDTFQAIKKLEIPLEGDSEKILRSRLAAAEDGSLLTTSSNTKDLQERLLALGTVTTIANACMLRLLGYQGPLVNYGRLGYPSVDLGPIAPPKPRGKRSAG